MVAHRHGLHTNPHEAVFLVKPAGTDVVLAGVEPDGCDVEVVGGDALGLAQQGPGNSAAVAAEAHVALGARPPGSVRHELKRTNDLHPRPGRSRISVKPIDS